jgi:parallel beta-helix repeat protein
VNPGILVTCSVLLVAGCGTSAPNGPSAQICAGVTLQATTTNLQAVVNANPEGTTFCFRPGAYRLTGPVLARSRDRFVGEPGAVLDGQGAVAKGIWGYGGQGGQRDVLVQGLTLVNFTDTAVVMGWHWTVSRNDIHHNQTGIAANSYGTLDSNYIHENRQYGIIGGPGTDLLILNNEVARNNTSVNCRGACAADAGGSKIVGSSVGTFNLTWRNNNVHDNIGPGIWSDGNVRATYEGNIVSNNSGPGILHELSWDAIIRNNTLKDNASESVGRSCWWGANLMLNTSSNVEAYSNTIIGNNGSNGICAVSAGRTEVAPYPTLVANFYAHDNNVSMNGSATSGHATEGAAPEPRLGTNNRFAHNRYRVPDLSKAWWTWPTASEASWSAWRAAGQDTDGTVSTW